MQWEKDTRHAPILIAHFEEGGVSGSHDVPFLREFLFPLKLKRMEEVALPLKNIRLYDEYWRLVRNAGIRNMEQLKDIAGATPIPPAITKMVTVQSWFSPGLLRNGFVSKLMMFLSYIAQSFVKEK